MKTRLVAALALLTLFAIGALYAPLTEPAGAQSSQRPRTDSEVKQAPDADQKAKIKIGGGGLSATCFCRVTANGAWVAEPSKGGYVQPVQREACRNYCRGLWDSGQAQRMAWAKMLDGACGQVNLSMDAKLGTLGYENVRNGSEYGVNGTQFVTTCTCPPGKAISNPFADTKYCITSTGTQFPFPVPDQVLQGGTHLIQSQTIYQIHGNPSCVTKCQ
jgi:hypothetical protein